MEELMPIIVNEKNEQLVSGRVVHEFMEVETPYHVWFPRQCEFGGFYRRFGLSNNFVRKYRRTSSG